MEFDTVKEKFGLNVLDINDVICEYEPEPVLTLNLSVRTQSILWYWLLITLVAFLLKIIEIEYIGIQRECFWNESSWEENKIICDDSSFIEVNDEDIVVELEHWEQH